MKNKGFSLVELIIVMAIMGILGLAVAGFIGTSSNQYKSATKEVDLQYEAQLTMNQIGDLLIDAQKGVKYESGLATNPVEVASANEESGVAVQTAGSNAVSIDNFANVTGTDNASETDSNAASTQAASSDSKLIIYDSDCTYNIIYRPADSKIYLRKDTVDESTGNVVEGQESLMAEHVVGFTPDLSEAESKNSVKIVVDFKNGDKTYTSTQNFTMRNKVPVGKDVEYVPEPEEPISVRIYYQGNDVSGGSVSYTLDEEGNSNILEFTSKIIGGSNPSQDVEWSYTGSSGDWTGTTFNPSGNKAKLSIGSNEASKKFVVTVKSKEDPTKYTFVNVNIFEPKKWLTNQETRNNLNQGATLKTWLQPDEVRNSGVIYNSDDFEWHIEAYQIIDGQRVRDNDILVENAEERGNYNDGKNICYHIDQTYSYWPTYERNQTVAFTAGNNLGNKQYDILVWVTLKSDPSVGSNVITVRCR